MSINKIRPQLSLLYLLLLIVVLSFSSCKNKYLNNRSDLIKYINNPDNGLVETDSCGKISISLLFKPWQLIVQRQNKTIKKNLSDELEKKYFFVLSFSAGNKEILKQLPTNEYGEMVQTFAFRMNQFISAVTENNHEVTPESCLFEQTYGLSDANQILIVFSNSAFENEKNINIIINEFGLKTGTLSFKFHMDDIKKLQINNL